VSSPRLIPAMAEPESRKKLVEFARDVLSVRALREELAERLRCQATQSGEFRALEKTLKACARLVAHRDLGEWDRARLETGISEGTAGLERLRGLRAFFANVAAETGAPVPGNSEEAWRVLLAVETVEKTPERIRSWRRKLILEASQRVRLEAWRDRARPLVETRKRLEAVFRLDELKIEPLDLRACAEALRAHGLLVGFKAPYREALKSYRGWLEPVALKALGRETGDQMAARLDEWAAWIEQSRQFENHPEARHLFGSHYRGIDTDFATALEANAWATHVTEELADTRDELREDAFGAALIELVFTITEDKTGILGMLANGAPSRAARTVLEEAGVLEGAPFDEIERDRKTRLTERLALRNALAGLTFSEQARFGELAELAARAGEAAFLLERMESDVEAQTLLRGHWAGMETDLAPIEQAARYVKSVRESRLPQALATTFLTAAGPQRLVDTRKMAARALSSMASVREHFQKLEEAIDGRALSSLTGGSPLREMPIVDLMNRFQRVLKAPGTLGGNC
jgi:hypothetical protein